MSIEVQIEFDPQNRSYGEMKSEAVAKWELHFVKMVLSRFEGNISAAAKALRMDRKHLHSLAKKHGLR